MIIFIWALMSIGIGAIAKACYTDSQLRGQYAIEYV